VFDEVYITDVLEKRPPKSADAEARKDALLILAKTMAQRPEALLPQFIDLAMELAGGVSGGNGPAIRHHGPAKRCASM
jgi:hypothetical protein